MKNLDVFVFHVLVGYVVQGILYSSLSIAFLYDGLLVLFIIVSWFMPWNIV